MQQMMLLGPEKAFTLFKSMMTTEVKIMLQLLFDVCCDPVTQVRNGSGELVSAVQAWDFFTEWSLTDITLYQNIAYHVCQSDLARHKKCTQGGGYV